MPRGNELIVYSFPKNFIVFGKLALPNQNLLTPHVLYSLKNPYFFAAKSCAKSCTKTLIATNTIILKKLTSQWFHENSGALSLNAKANASVNMITKKYFSSFFVYSIIYSHSPAYALP